MRCARGASSCRGELREGRLQLAHFGRLSVVDACFPGDNGEQRDDSRVRLALDFYRALSEGAGPVDPAP